MTTNSNIRAALERHWAASDANDFDAEHQIYRQDAVLEYPAIGRADSRPRQNSGVSNGAAELQAIFSAANCRCCQSLGDRIHPHLRWAAIVYGEHHGI